MSSRALFLIASLALLTGSSARADDCDDVTPVDGERRQNAPATAAPATAAPIPVEVVVPCAVVDDGGLGADCPEVWVMNDQGTLLCRVALLAFDAASPMPEFHRVDGGVHDGGTFVAVGVVPALPGLPSIPLVRDGPATRPAPADGPADGHTLRGLRPS
jgi:hypothetical protein